MNFNSNIKVEYCTIKFSEVTPHINLTSDPPRVRLQSVLDHQFRIEFPSTGKKRDPSIPGARKTLMKGVNDSTAGELGRKLTVAPFFTTWSGFTVPVQAPTRGHPFTVIPRNHPISLVFYDAHGDTEDLFSSYSPRDTFRRMTPWKEYFC